MENKEANLPRETPLEIVKDYNLHAWIRYHRFKNENGEPMEFHNFRYLIAPAMDMAKIQATMKCAQAGYTTLEIFKGFFIADRLKANLIHTLPTKTITTVMVAPKVNKIIAHNPRIREMIGETDSTNLKQVGDRFIYYRGSFEETQAITIAANALLRDELDRSNQSVLEIYETRLGESNRTRPDLGFIWDFSNPSTPNFGIHERYLKSDQKIWLVTCPHCRRRAQMVWPESVDFQRKVFICRLCGKELSDDDRRMGEWAALYPGRRISGYHISKLMIPWTTAAEVIEASEGDPEIFHNFWLGLPYLNPDVQVTRESILNAIVLTENPRTDVVIGVDNGVVKHYVVGNRTGIFDYGATKDWDEIEKLLSIYPNSVMVIDAMPHPHKPTQLATSKEYRGRVFLHWFSPDTHNLGIVRWGEGKEFGRVLVDRTRVMDLVADEVNRQVIVFNLPLVRLEPYISHWEAIYRAVSQDEKGGVKADWLTKGSKPDHWCLATELWRVGMEKRRISAGGPWSYRRELAKKKIPVGVSVSRAGPVGSTTPSVPGYDLEALKKRLGEKKRKGRPRDIFRPPQRNSIV